jgi:hypothetical protein
MTIRSGWWQRSLLAAIVVTSLTPTTQAVILYRETFGRDPANGGTGNIGTQNFDWGRWNAAGTLTSITSGVNGADPGKPTDLLNVNAGPYYNNVSPGPYERGWQFLDGTARLAMTPEYSVNPAEYPGLKFSWYQGNQVPGQDFKLAVRVGGSWYASLTTFQNAAVANGPAFNAGAELKSLNYSPTAANWLTLNFNGDHDVMTHISTVSSVALSLGAAPGADLSGPITAFGLYRDVTGNNARFDSFTIESLSLPGDTDNDGIPGEYPDDFNPIRDNFRKSPRSHNQGDLDGNSIVDFADFREWKAAALGAGTSLEGIDLGFLGNVPEPGSGLLAILAALSAVTARSRGGCRVY